MRATNTRKFDIVCSYCGSKDVRRNADAKWNVKKQKWEVVDIFDSTTCEKCNGECSIKEVPISS